MEAYIILNLLKYKQNVTIQSIDNCKKESASKIQKMVREVHQLINDYGEEPFEVRNLSLQLPSIHAESSVVLALMKRCSKIQSFRLDYTTRFLDGWLGGVDFEALSAESLSRIQYISGSPTFSDSIWGSIIKTCQPLVSLDLSTDLSPSISQALSGHIASLRHLSFTSIGCRRLNLSVLASLPNLETFHGIYLLSGPSDIMAMPDWTCLGLKKLHIGIRLDDRSRRPIQVTEDTLESWIMGISEARHRLLEQIGRLTHLQSLNIFESDISYYDNMRDRISPTIANTASGHGISYMGLGHGLELLRDLEDLVDVTMDGVFETFTRNSIEWMTEHWPKLEKLTQLVHPLDPMPTEMLSKLESNDVTKDSGWMSELKRRRPKLNIKITTEEDGVRDHCDFCGDELNIYEESQDESFLNQIGLYEEDVARYI
ncbi:hypothetical protein BGZ76_008824 [Entomortierella beljakovae]|nr:hypothetical protein BGZ76_008824 [Entomortierella beljakovae]